MSRASTVHCYSCGGFYDSDIHTTCPRCNQPHSIILRNDFAVAICLTRGFAEELAKAEGYSNCRIEPARKRDIEHLLGGYTPA